MIELITAPRILPHVVSTIKDLQKRFGVSGNIIGAALEKTTAEWKAMAATAPERISYQPRKAIPLGITVAPKESSTSQTSKHTTCETTRWEYRTAIVRGRLMLNDVVYEQQRNDNSDWKPMAAKTFADALNLFGKDGWACDKKIHHRIRNVVHDKP